jgi:leucyl/phenylalanyl-tRNA--protein transferase
MAVFALTRELAFPSPAHAEENGLLAVGGDLSPRRLLLAYTMGIFPWYSEGQPILWWSPDPRLVLFPEELRVSRSLGKTIRKNLFRVTVDTAFGEVIASCARVHRRDDGGTWLTGEMVEAYRALHRLGFAHSVECWHEEKLAGGLYGMALGRAFFGESMFSLEPDASKVALVRLVEELRERAFEIIDCQVSTMHLVRMGAREIPREEFLRILSGAVEKAARPGKWESGECR